MEGERVGGDFARKRKRWISFAFSGSERKDVIVCSSRAEEEVDMNRSDGMVSWMLAYRVFAWSFSRQEAKMMNVRDKVLRSARRLLLVWWSLALFWAYKIQLRRDRNL